MNIINSLLNIPNHICVSCNRISHNPICNKCFAKLEYYLNVCPICNLVSKDGNVHNKCLNPFSIYSTYSMYRYTRFSKDIFKGIKYKYVTAAFNQLISNPFIHRNLDNLFQNSIPKDSKIIYVPQFIIKSLDRNVYIPQLIAQYISKRYGREIINLIYKSKPTPSVSKLKYSQRESILLDSFKIVNIHRATRLQNVLIIDDVISSKSTIKTISRILKEQNIVQRIYALSLFGTTHLDRGYRFDKFVNM